MKLAEIILFLLPAFINKHTSGIYDMKYLFVFTPHSFKGAILEFFSEG
jgi:hypothetical protein